MIALILLVIGLALLVKGAGFLIDGASSIAKNYGISSLLIGLTIVALGTSMPELAVNLIASFEAQSEIALGNIVGSNITNILLVLGIVALITRLKVKTEIIKNELPIALFATALLSVIALKSFFEGKTITVIANASAIILLLTFIAYFYFIIVFALKSQQKNSDSQTKKITNKKAILFALIGIIFLAIGGNLTVNNAVEIAKAIGISNYIISATIIAIGTSLPELITVIMAALRKKFDLGLGTIIGSNIANILFILGVSALINPISINLKQGIGIAVMLIATLALFAILVMQKQPVLSRKHGLVFLALYIIFLITLI